MPLRVLYLVGSAVSDFFVELSLVYARDCLAATADAARYDVSIAYVEPGGRWRFPGDLSAHAIRAAPAMPLDEAVSVLGTLELDVMVPQMFCLPGMTTYRSLFELLGTPYVGNRPDVMALAADKAKAKAVVAQAGVLVPHGEVLGLGDAPSIVPPAVVKPLDSDNSLGLGLVRDPEEYAGALSVAFAHSDRVLVEEFVPLGREVRCGIVVRDGELVCLPLEEYNVDSETRPIRLAADKLAQDDDGSMHLVAKTATRSWIVDVANPATETVWAAARLCHLALGARDYSLFDFRIDPQGRPWFLEAGLYCSFAEQSVIPVMAKAAGIPVTDLLDNAVRQAVDREKGKQQ